MKVPTKQSNTQFDNKLYKGLFVILLVAILVTIFEMIFYAVAIKPIAVSRVKDFIDSQKNTKIKIPDSKEDIDITGTVLKEVVNSLGPQHGGLADGLLSLTEIKRIDDEIDENIKDIKTKTTKNILTKSQEFLTAFKEREDKNIVKLSLYSYSLILIELIFLTIFAYMIYRIINVNSIGSSVVTALVIMIAIGIFQYSFYIFGLNYFYTGGTGAEEVYYYLFSEIEKNIDKKNTK